MNMKAMENITVPDDALKEIDDLLADTPETPQQAQQPVVDPTEFLTEELRRIREEIKEVKQPVETDAKTEDGLNIDIPELDDDKLGKLASYKDQLETIAKHATGENLKAVLDEIKKLKAELNETKQQLSQTAQNTFASTLRAAIPDIDELHRRPEFAEYLKQPAPFSGGRTLAQLLEDAYKSQDLGRVREIIDGFKSSGQDAEEHAVPGIPSIPARPEVRARKTAATNTSPGNIEDKIFEARNKLMELFRNRRISYETYLAKKQELDLKAAGLANGV